MATVAHTIYSHYDPRERETIERETGQLSDDDATDSTVWQTQRRRGPPRFIPATISQGGSPGGSSSSSRIPITLDNEKYGNDLAGWYRSLTNGGRRRQRDPSRQSPPSCGEPDNSKISLPQRRKQEKMNKNNWFIMKAIESEPVSAPPTVPSTLADILSRDPPPLPTQKKYTPPVWLTLGPSNKGFSMLQQSGWNEGEALGPSVLRRGNATSPDTEMPHQSSDEKGAGRRRVTVKHEMKEIGDERAGDTRGLRTSEVIDLTHSDSDLDNEDLESAPEVEDDPIPSPTIVPSASAHSGTALLTPIPIVLKSDRLGIGLKAKTFGPYKASQKRVTHNAAAMAAHIRGAEELRKRKKEVGRGWRGFQKIRKKEDAHRRKMLAYLNTD